MHRTLRFFITSIFLCAAFSSEAQQPRDWALEAATHERAAFEATDPHDAAAALAAKASCYRQEGRYGEAAATLGRIQMYALSPEERSDILYRKELYHYLAGEYASAASCLDEAGPSAELRRLRLDALVLGECGRWAESRAAATDLLSRMYEGEELDAAQRELDDLFMHVPRLKEEKQAVFRSFLPPLGQMYSGHVSEGLQSMLLNAAAAGWTVWQCLSGNWITGLLGGGVALNATFMGGMERSVQLAEQYNRDAMRAFNDALRSLLRAHGAAV